MLKILLFISLYSIGVMCLNNENKANQIQLLDDTIKQEEIKNTLFKRSSQLEELPFKKFLSSDFNLNELNKRNDDKEEAEDDDESDTSKKSKKNSKKEESNKAKKKLKKQEDDEEDDEEEKSDKLTDKQLKQVYKFLKKKDKKSKKKNSNENSLFLNSLLASPNIEVHSKLKDSLAAKAANDALLKWHSKSPFANLNQLEEMYNKFYEFYYDFFDSNKIDHYNSHHYHHDHHHSHHDHHNLNLLDFLASKQSDEEIEEEDDDYKNKKDSLFNKIINSNYLNSNPWDDYHHRHYLSHKSPIYYDSYYSRLKSKLNYYISHDLEPPISLLNRLNHYSAHLGHEHEYEPYHSFYHDYHPVHFDTRMTSPHHHYHYNEHPVYDEYGRQIIYTSGQLERFPSSLQNENSKSPVVCSNYPDHSTEGFKSFISVESCNQPSYLGNNGIPLFGNGCTFRYICELGYQPLGGLSSSIKCNNGFWSARAVCIKQDITGLNKNNNLNSPSLDSQNGFIKRSEESNENKEFNRLKRSTNDKEEQVAEQEENLNNKIETESVEETETDSTLETTLETNTTTDTTTTIKPKEETTLLDLLTQTTRKIKVKSNRKNIDQTQIDPKIDWSSIMNSDSEKTIYESFYELLDNGIKNFNFMEYNGNKKEN